MSDLFGAPIGIDAYDQNQRQNVLGALNAGKILGEIEQQPAHKALLESQARLHGAEAGLKENELAQQTKLMSLMNGPQGEQATNADPVTRMEQIGGMMLGTGAFTKGSELLNKASEIRSRMATAATAEIRQGLLEARTNRLRAESVGSLAGSATADTWATVKPQLEEAVGHPLPDDFMQAQQFLPQLTQAGMTAAQQLAAKEKKLEATALQAHRAAQEREWSSRITRANASVRLIDERINRLKKDGGDISELRKERTLTERARREAIQGKANIQRQKDLAPVDPSLRQPGKAYQSPSGKWAQWTKEGWLPLAEQDSGDDNSDDEGDE